MIPFCFPKEAQNLFVLPLQPYNFILQELKHLNVYSPASDYLQESHKITKIHHSHSSIYKQIELTPCNIEQLSLIHI